LNQAIIIKKIAKAENTESTYRRNLHSAKYLKKHFKERRIRSIENNEILMRQYINKRKAQIRDKQLKHGRTEAELSFTSINRELAFMRKMFNILIASGKTNKNPVSLVTFFDEVEKERVLTQEEENLIFKTLDELDKRYIHLKDMITIALNTAMREGEILSMEKGWIDLKDCFINVPKYFQKRKKRDKRVPINSVILPIYRKAIEAE